MTKILTQYGALALAVALMVPLAQAQSAEIQTAFGKDAATLSDKFSGLAHVMAGKYDWKPGQGVRSVGDVFNLIVLENGLLAGALSGTPNTGANPAPITDPGKLQEALKASYANLQKAITGLSDRDLQAPVKLFGRDMTKQSALMLQGMTAQVVIRQVYPVKAGDLILVHAAAGGTGLILCQWAAALGATVIGTVSTEAKAELAHAHGCKHTILYSKQDFVAEVTRISGGEKLPVVFDSVGKDTLLCSLDCLRSRGLMVRFGQASGPIDPIAPVLLSQKGSLFLTRPILLHYIARREELEASANELFNVVASGKVRVNVNQRFALKDAAEAHKALEARATSGSTILTI